MKIPEFVDDETYTAHSSMTFSNLKRMEESKTA